MTSLDTSNADELFQEMLEKLKTRKIRPFKVTSVQSHTITFDDNGIETTVSIDKAFLARQINDLSQSLPTADHQFVERSVSSETPPDTPPIGIEHGVEKIIWHSEPLTDWRYTVQWYESVPADDTDEPADIPKHFITRYWRRI